MDQQHASDPATGHPDIHAGDAGRHEAHNAPASTVLSEGEWLAVSTEGFSEQQRGRPLEHLVKELVQNALDSVGGSGRIDLDVQPTGPRRATVRCADDGPGADEARCLFPELLSASPGMAPAVSGGRVPDDPGHDGTGEEDRPRPSWMQRLRLRMQGQSLVADSRRTTGDGHG